MCAKGVLRMGTTTYLGLDLDMAVVAIQWAVVSAA